MPAGAHALTDTPGRVDKLLAQAYEIRHEDTRQALALNQAAQAMALRLDYGHGVAYGLLRTSLCLLILGDDEPGCAAQLLQATALLRSLGDWQGEAEALNLQGHLSSRRNDALGALACHERCLSLRRQGGDVVGQAASLNNMALQLQSLGQHADALEQLLASLTLAERAGDARATAYALTNIGGLLLETDEAASSLDYFERSLALNAATRDRAAESSTRMRYGQALLQQGREADALTQLQRACELARQTGNRADLVHALTALGRAEQQAGHLDEAHSLLEAALDSQTPLNDPTHRAEVLCALGRNQCLQRRHADALQTLTDALAAADLAHAEQVQCNAHALLADVHEAAARFEPALRHLRASQVSRQRLQSQDTQRRVRELMTQVRLAPVQRDAEAHRHRAAELAGELDDARRWAREKEALLVQLSSQAEMLEKLAREDGLTGVANRRWLDLHLSRECERARRFHHPLAVAMIDVADFKQVNDRHSHAVGDAVLRRLAQLLRDGCRASDQVGRYGGEEFMLVLAETTADNAVLLCDKLLRQVQAEDWQALHPGLPPVTVSIGVAGSDPLGAVAAAELAARADRELYRAKQEGKNRVCR